MKDSHLFPTMLSSGRSGWRAGRIGPSRKGCATLMGCCVLLLSAPGGGAVCRAQETRQAVLRELEHRTGLFAERAADAAGPTEAAPDIEAMLRNPLSPTDAVRIALNLNPSVKALYERLGIAQGDLIQAGLLKNPEVEAGIRFAAGGPGANREFQLTQDVLDILLRPIRRRVASEELERTKHEVGDALLGIIAEVKSAWYVLAGSTQILRVQTSVVDGAEAAAELSRRQHVAGNVSVLDYSSQQAAYQQARLERRRVQMEVATARETLGRLLGLTGSGRDWRVTEELPGLPEKEPELVGLEGLALSRRPDLAAVGRGVRALEHSLELERKSVFGAVKLGVNTEQEPAGMRVTGPVMSFELPIFDRRQGTKKRLRAEIDQGRHRLEGLELTALSEVRIALERLAAARVAWESYRETLQPLQAEIVEQSQRQYNFMLSGVYELLLAKQNELSIRRDSIRAQMDYWLAWTALERAAGGPLETSPTSAGQVRRTASGRSRVVPRSDVTKGGAR